jgi:hypothetical protein
MRIVFVALMGVFSAFAGLRHACASYTETYDNGSDVGQWVASFNVPRQIQSAGGSPLGPGIPLGSYLQQGGFSSSIPTWGTASTRYQPGFNDQFKENSVFVGDWTAAGVTDFSVDLNVIQSGNWPAPGRPLTLQLMQMDDTGFGVNYVATYTTALMATPPIGWTHYDFTINAGGGVVPSGWVFTHGDGSPATNAEWSTFLSRVDLTSIGYYAPGTFYPSTGTWTLGIDNPSVTTTVPEPRSIALLLLGICGIISLYRRAEKRRRIAVLQSGFSCPS